MRSPSTSAGLWQNPQEWKSIPSTDIKPVFSHVPVPVAKGPGWFLLGSMNPTRKCIWDYSVLWVPPVGEADTQPTGDAPFGAQLICHQHFIRILGFKLSPALALMGILRSYGGPWEKQQFKYFFTLFLLTGPTGEPEISTFKEEQDHFIRTCPFLCHPWVSAVGSRPPSQADPEPWPSLFIHLLADPKFGISASRSKEVDSSTCRGSKKSKKR